MSRTLEPTWNVCFKIWWALFWRNTLLSFGAGFFAAMFGGMLAKLGGGNVGKMGFSFGLIAGITMGIVAMRMVLRKNFRDWKIELIEKPRSVTEHIGQQLRKEKLPEKGE